MELAQSYEVALSVVKKALGNKEKEFTFEQALVGGAAIDATGHPLPPETLKLCESSSAIFLDPSVDQNGKHYHQIGNRNEEPCSHCESILIYFANLRPAIIYPELKKASPIRADIIGDGLDILILRELTSGIYFGKPKGREGSGAEEFAFDTMRYSRREIERIARTAFLRLEKEIKKLQALIRLMFLQRLSSGGKLLWTSIRKNSQIVPLNTSMLTMQQCNLS